MTYRESTPPIPPTPRADKAARFDALWSLGEKTFVIGMVTGCLAMVWYYAYTHPEHPPASAKTATIGPASCQCTCQVPR